MNAVHNMIFTVVWGCVLPLCAGGCVTGELKGTTKCPAAPSFLLDVVPVRAGFGRCGAAAAVSVAQYYQADVKAGLATGLTRERFVDTLQIVRFLRACGVECTLVRSSVPEILSDLELGRPAVVLVDPHPGVGGTFFRHQMPSHCWVVRGSHDNATRILISTPSFGPRAVTRKTFEHMWRNRGYVAIRFAGNREPSATNNGGQRPQER